MINYKFNLYFIYFKDYCEIKCLVKQYQDNRDLNLQVLSSKEIEVLYIKLMGLEETHISLMITEDSQQCINLRTMINQVHFYHLSRGIQSTYRPLIQNLLIIDKMELVEILI